MILAEYFTLTGKIALITSCSSRIGEAMAIGLAEAGADIIGISSTLTKGSDVEKEVIKTGRNFSPYAFDLVERKEVYKAIETIRAEHRKIDILINNSGIVLRNPTQEKTNLLRIWILLKYRI